MSGELKLIPVDRLVLPPDRIRLRPEEGLEELVESVKAVGVVQPIVARPLGRNRFEVVAGERRLRATKKAGLREVPVVVRSLSDEEADIFKLTENLQRENLTDYEVALWLKRLRERYGLSTRKLASIMGKSQSWIVRQLNMLKVEEVMTRVITESPALRRSVKPRSVMNKLTEGHCRAVLSAPEDYHRMLCEKIALAVSQGLEPPSMKEIEKTWRTAEEAEREIRERVEAELKELRERAEPGFEPGWETEVEEGEEGEGPLGYWICQFCGAWMPGESISPIPEEMKRHIKQVHGWKPDPAGGTYWEAVIFSSEPGEGGRLEELELTKGYWICNLCKGWMPGYDLAPPEPMKTHLIEEHGWEPPHPGAWGEALTFSEIAPGEGRRIDREPEFIDTGVVFTCPVCGWQATIRHHSDGRHTFQRIRVEEG